MDSKEEAMFLENIEEFVMDEGKIVTYKWLSKTLDIHVNASKKLLYKYALPNDVKKLDTHITYVVGGTLKDGCGVKVHVCREDELDQVKSQFKDVNFEHIYSVQKLVNIPDLNILYSVDSLKTEQMHEERLGAITCTKATRRRDKDIAALRVEAIAARAVATKAPVIASKKPLSAPAIVKPSEVKSTDDVKSAEHEKPKTIASMFSAQSKKPPASNGKAPAGNNAAKKGKGIASFFSKQPDAPKTTEDFTARGANTNEKKTSGETIYETTNLPSKTSSTEEKSHQSIKAEMINVKITPKSKLDVKSEADSKTQVKANTTMNGTGGKGKNKNKSSKRKVEKKRKRIMTMSDSGSSDDDIFGKEEDDNDVDMRAPSPDITIDDSPRKNSSSSDEDIIPPTPVQTASGKVRIRTRKLVDKTFVDEDGFVITKKEMVFESGSEEETEKNKNGNEKLAGNSKNSKDEISKSTEKEKMADNTQNKDASKSVKEKEEVKSKEDEIEVRKESKKSTIVATISKGEKVIEKATKKASKATVENEDEEEDNEFKRNKGKAKKEVPSENGVDEGKKNKKDKRKKKEAPTSKEGDEEPESTQKKGKRKRKEESVESQEEEEGEKNKKTKKKETKKTATPPVNKGKQQTLMSFFSKK